jgi:hypothetical protein
VAHSVEKLRFTSSGKFVRIFRSPDAHITVAFSASEALLGGFSCAIYHPLVSRVRKWAQIATEIVALFKTEFFNSIGRFLPLAQLIL